MNIFLFLVRTRLVSNFTRKPLWGRLALQLLMLLILSFYAVIFGHFLNEVTSPGSELNLEVTPLQLVVIANMIFFGITLLRTLFPVYKPRVPLIPALYPLSRNARFWIELGVEACSAYFCFTLLFWLIVLLLSDYFTVLHLVFSCSVLLAAHLLRRIFQTALETRQHYGSPAFLASAALLATGLLSSYLWLQQPEPFEWTSVLLYQPLFFFSLLLSNYILEQTVLETKTRREHIANYRLLQKYPSLSLLYNNKRVRTLLLMGYVFKILMLIFSLGTYHNSGEFPAYFVLFVFPVVLFTYVFNNAWGFYRTIWLRTEMAGGTIWQLLRTYLNLLAAPLAIDFVITAAFMAFMPDVLLELMPAYILSVLLLLPIGLVASLIKPVAPSTNIYFKTHTSQLFAIASMAAVAFLVLPLKHYLFYLAYPVLLGFAIFAAVAVLKSYRQYKFALYEKVFKTKAD